MIPPLDKGAGAGWLRKAARHSARSRLETLRRRILMQHRYNGLPLQSTQVIKKQPLEKARLLLYSVVNLKVFFTDRNKEIRVLYGSIYLLFATKRYNQGAQYDPKAVF